MLYLYTYMMPHGAYHNIVWPSWWHNSCHFLNHVLVCHVVCFFFSFPGIKPQYKALCVIKWGFLFDIEILLHFTKKWKCFINYEMVMKCDDHTQSSFIRVHALQFPNVYAFLKHPIVSLAVFGKINRKQKIKRQKIKCMLKIINSYQNNRKFNKKCNLKNS